MPMAWCRSSAFPTPRRRSAICAGCRPDRPRPGRESRQARAFGPSCAQITTLGPFAGPANANEDCLYLNVFAPDGVAKKLPVLLWIHGGGHVDGRSNDYDPGKLVRAGLVVVTINYRLGLFGYLAHPALDAEGHAFGNYAILDQQAALRWVHDNIATFGGDPGNVTIAGQSAGASSASFNVLSPLAKGLFQRAIYESGGYNSPLIAAQDRRRQRASNSPPPPAAREIQNRRRRLPAPAAGGENPGPVGHSQCQRTLYHGPDDRRPPSCRARRSRPTRPAASIASR